LSRYKSFSRNADNIGDITGDYFISIVKSNPHKKLPDAILAKGEAQIAVIDLVGMVCGIYLSRIIETSRIKIILAFIVLSAMDLFCIFNEIKRYEYKHFFEIKVVIFVSDQLLI